MGSGNRSMSSGSSFFAPPAIFLALIDQFVVSRHFITFCGAGHWGRRANKLTSRTGWCPKVCHVEMYVSHGQRDLSAQVPKTASNKGGF